MISLARRTMRTYLVFNQKNVQCKVSDEDLERAASEDGPLATHLANAAAAARFHPLRKRLQQTLSEPPRLQKLAAARALLALADQDSSSLLRERAAEEKDAVVANLFLALALRLEGVEALRAAFEAGEVSPELARCAVSVYNGQFDITSGDVEFLTAALDAYLDATRGWFRSLRLDLWQNGVYLLVHAATSETVSQVLASHREPASWARLRQVMTRVTTSRADRDAKAAAKRWLQKT
jgi:hypothetical protein